MTDKCLDLRDYSTYSRGGVERMAQGDGMHGGKAARRETYRGDVESWECDAFGHMNIAFYAERFGDASASLLFPLAPDRAWRTASLFVRYEKELLAGESIAIDSGVIGLGAGAAKGERNVRIGHRLTMGSGAVAAVAEHTLVPRDLKMRAGLAGALDKATVAFDAKPFAPVALPPAHGPVASLRDRVKSWELDERGQLSLWGHMRRFSTACGQLMNAAGMDAQAIASQRRGFATFESRLALSAWQPGTGAEVAATSGFLALGRSSIVTIHDLVEVKGGDRIARCYLAGVYFDLDARKSAPLPDALRAKAAPFLVAKS